MQGKVIAAFPACGKSHIADELGALDSDSSNFSWATPKSERRRHPNWPANYMTHIREAVASGKTVFVSTHEEVRTALHEAGIPFTLVYPDPSLKDEYRQRMIDRGTPQLVPIVIDKLWDDALASCAAQEGCTKIVLSKGEYLSDVI
jgi:hypothetical protein